MTTNRMGLTPEQAANTFTDEQIESLVYGNNPQSNVYRELLAYRKASKEADGDDNFYSWFSREWEQYYQPNQYTTSAKQHLGAIAESAWFACRATMLKSVTNEP